MCNDEGGEVEEILRCRKIEDEEDDMVRNDIRNGKMIEDNF